MKTIKRLFILVLCFVIIATNIPTTTDNLVVPYGHLTDDDLPNAS